MADETVQPSWNRRPVSQSLRFTAASQQEKEKLGGIESTVDRSIINHKSAIARDANEFNSEESSWTTSGILEHVADRAWVVWQAGEEKEIMKGTDNPRLAAGLLPWTSIQ